MVLLDIICVTLPAKMLIKMDTVWAFNKMFSIIEEQLSETAVVCTATYFIKI